MLQPSGGSENPLHLIGPHAYAGALDRLQRRLQLQPHPRSGFCGRNRSSSPGRAATRSPLAKNTSGGTGAGSTRRWRRSCTGFFGSSRSTPPTRKSLPGNGQAGSVAAVTFLPSASQATNGSGGFSMALAAQTRTAINPQAAKTATRRRARLPPSRKPFHPQGTRFHGDWLSTTGLSRKPSLHALTCKVLPAGTAIGPA